MCQKLSCIFHSFKEFITPEYKLRIREKIKQIIRPNSDKNTAHRDAREMRGAKRHLI